MTTATAPSGQQWPGCDHDIASFVTTVVESVQQSLDPHVVGVYLHGSLAMGSYFRPKSDIDMLVVVTEPVSAQVRRAAGEDLALRADQRPTVGSLELSVVTAAVAATPPVPTPFELHYSEMWHERILAGDVDWQAQRTDPDLPAHLTVVRRRGLAVTGPPVEAVFGEVPWEDFVTAVVDDTTWIISEDNLLQSPFYGVLNICRCMEALTSPGRAVLNKEEGGRWGLAHLPARHHPIIEQALAAYRSTRPVSVEQRLTNGEEWDPADLKALRDYARRMIATESVQSPARDPWA